MGNLGFFHCRVSIPSEPLVSLPEYPDQGVTIEEGQDGHDKNSEAYLNPLEDLQFSQFLHVLLLDPFRGGMDHELCKSNLGIGMTFLAGLKGGLPFFQRETGMSPVTIGAISRSFISQ